MSIIKKTIEDRRERSEGERGRNAWDRDGDRRAAIGAACAGMGRGPHRRVGPAGWAPNCAPGHTMHPVCAREHRPRFEFVHSKIFRHKQPTINWLFHRLAL